MTELDRFLAPIELAVPPLPEGADWRESIKGFQDRPRQRLALALAHLPAPKAFAEAVTALRRMLQDSRREGSLDEDALALMYQLAATDSFLYDTPVIEGIGRAEYVFEDADPAVWADLEMPYPLLGFRKFRLLTRADGRILRETWGPPQKQQSAQKFHLIAWEDAVEEYIDKHGLF